MSRQVKKKECVILIFCFALLLLFSFLSFTFEIDHPWETLQEVLTNYDPTAKEQVILLSRLSRVIVALLAGASLSLSGFLMQLHYHNALADPSLMGVTDGAALAVVVTLAFWPASNLLTQIMASLIGSFVAYSFIRTATRRVTRMRSAVSLPLLGVILSMILSSLTTLVASYFNLSRSMTSWYNSRLYRVELQQVHYFLWPLLLAILLLCLFRKQLAVYRFGPKRTISLGMNHAFYEKMLLLLVVLLTGVTVAIIGRITFLGLIVPHMARLLFGNRCEKLVFFVPLLGALFVLAADYCSRWLNYPFETPVGVMFALIGVPIFLWLIKHGKGNYNEI